MTEEKVGGRALKRQVLDLLMSKDLDLSLAKFRALPGRRVVNPLIGLLCHPSEETKWRAVKALGAVIDLMARSQIEDARVVMRRFMWMLNDESGGIGWGAPEAMGEIMARNRTLAEEFSSVLVSYSDERGNFIEHEALQRGLLWGIGRVAQVHPDLMKPAAGHLCKYLGSEDPTVRGLVAWASGFVGAGACIPELARMVGDATVITLFLDTRLTERQIGQLAADSLRLLEACEV
ncbi:MAG: DVU0298 family protein [Thermodesulfobacteriota bacterium]